MAANAPNPGVPTAIPGHPAPVAAPRRTRASAPDAPAENLAGLKRVARQFEAIFLGTLLKSMRATVPESDLFGDGGATRLYREWHDQELAEVISGSGSVGIGDLIVQQYGARFGAAAEPARTAPRSLAAALGRRGAAGGPPPAAPADPSLLARYDDAANDRGRRSFADLRRHAAAMGGATADTLGRYQQEIAGAARASGVDPALLLAVIQEESAGDAAAVSPRGALGLMQLMPGTAAEVGVDRPFDAAANLHGGARYLARMLERYDGRLDLALAAYNAGPGAVDRAGPAVPAYAETRRYVARVTARFGRLGGVAARPWHESGDSSR